MESESSIPKIIFSNAQLDLFPDNRPELFQNKLAQPLRLEGKWEVALLDLSYFHQWNNVKYPINLGILKSEPRRGKKRRYIITENSSAADRAAATEATTSNAAAAVVGAAAAAATREETETRERINKEIENYFKS